MSLIERDDGNLPTAEKLLNEARKNKLLKKEGITNFCILPEKDITVEQGEKNYYKRKSESFPF